ncbi:MAG: protease HtpX [Gammaproteobacteria bacterium]
MLRIGLFLATNLAVMFVLNLILTLLGLNNANSGYAGILIMAALFGMGGAFISLMMSKRMALRSARARVIETPTTEEEQWLVGTVQRQAQIAGIGNPDVAIFDSQAPNAFATGANKNSSLVAVSTGLMATMTRDEVEAVLGHEVSHVANGDMVTLTLIQGVLNTFVMVFAHVISSVVDGRRGGGGYNRTGYGYGGGFAYRMVYMAAQVVLGFLATIIVRWFSRLREYRADTGGAKLAGKEKMIAALERLQSLQQPAQLPAQMQAMGINGGLLGMAGLKKLTMTHPPLTERIAALRASS